MKPYIQKFPLTMMLILPILIIALSVHNMIIYGIDAGFYGFGHARTQFMFGILWIALIELNIYNPLSTIFIMAFAYSSNEVLYTLIYTAKNISYASTLGQPLTIAEVIITLLGLSVLLYTINIHKTINYKWFAISLVLLIYTYVFWYSIAGFPISTDTNMNGVSNYYEFFKDLFFIGTFYSLYKVNSI